MKIFRFFIIFTVISFLSLCIGSISLQNDERRQLEHQISQLPSQMQDIEAVNRLKDQVEKLIDFNGSIAFAGVTVSVLFFVFIFLGRNVFRIQ